MDETQSDKLEEEREWGNLPYQVSSKSFLQSFIACIRTRVNRGVYDERDKVALIDVFIQTFNYAFFVMFGPIKLMCIITDRDEYLKFIAVVESSERIPKPWRGEMVFDKTEMTNLLSTIDFSAIEHVDDIDYFYERMYLLAKARISIKGRRREIAAKISRKSRASITAIDRYYLARLQKESSTGDGTE